MNHRGGLALVRATWASWMQERGFFFMLAFLWMIPPLVALFVWLAAAESEGAGGQIAGLSRGAFVAYYLLVMLVNQLTYAQTNWTVGDVIRTGGLTPLLLRPLWPLYNVLASEVAGKVVFMAFVIPAAGVLSLLLKPELNPEAWQVLLFIPSLGMAWALRFFWGLWLALLAFWSTRADALLMVQDALVFMLAGIVAPMALLPEGMAGLAWALPFRYMVGFPVEILSGQLTPQGALAGLAVQAGWTVLAVTLAAVVWRGGVRRYAAVGG
jgi:ABC-2 type transport system permease protein